MRRFVIAIAVFLLTISAFAQLNEATIDKDARDTIEAWHVPGLAIAVVQNDKVIFLRDATISVVDQALMLHWERLTIPLLHENYDTFSAIDTTEDIDEPVQFRLGADGAVSGFTLLGEEFVAVRK